MTSRQGTKAQNGGLIFSFLSSDFGQHDPETPGLKFSAFYSLRPGALAQDPKAYFSSLLVT
jgi:hypothetical protein